MTPHSGHLFCFGLGYTARALATRLRMEGWRVSATCRTREQCLPLEAEGYQAIVFDSEPSPDDANAEALIASATAVLSSVPPDRDGDPVLRRYGALLARADHLKWIGYLSTTGVYGNTGGALVDETSPVQPTVERSVRRANAEHAWLDLYEQHRLPVHLFRLAGIYGPGRNNLEAVIRGEAKRIARPGHVFSRIHVEDIVTVLAASLSRPSPGRVYNVCDDEPAEPAEVIAFACRLLEKEMPPLVTFAAAEPHMSAMARSFWEDNRRVDNSRIKRELGVSLRYPDYRFGLRAIWADMSHASRRSGLADDGATR